ncbi:medium chain dehydrogenase/reductase family protein [Paractinoplanes ferrugineus]|uniref:NADPH:quinone reductase n=2 Tax=Paractinoplanes ferrugineus TaxID=113564 RepID=A0A919MGT7_9ACTN|nr:NADPH:quinone reductase [Actinoplanes ferrugineus]
MVLPSVGEPEVIEPRQATLAPIGSAQARVRVTVTGVSFAEQAMRRGKYYQQPAFPFVPGYDLVGVIEEFGADAPAGLALGQRVAALTKIGGWAEQVVLDAADLVPVPDAVTDQDAETVIINGLTAIRVLRLIGARRGATIVVLGAAGGVGSVLVQLALRAGLRVIGTAGPSQQDRLRALGVIPIDYRAEDVGRRVRELAPDGVAGVVDHVGGPGIRTSWRMLARGGYLVSLSDMSVAGAKHPMVPFMRHYLRLQLWNILPNGRHAKFFDIWAGHRDLATYRRRLSDDLQTLFAHLVAGDIHAPIDSVYPLKQAAAALRRAEQGGLAGKILLVT